MNGYKKYLLVILLVILVGIGGFTVWNLQNNNASESNALLGNEPSLLGGTENRGDEPNQMGSDPADQNSTFTPVP